MRIATWLLAAAVAASVVTWTGTSAEAETARICGNRVEFPGTVRHFRLDEADPFGHRAELTGAEQREGDRFLLRFNCWRLNTTRTRFPEEPEALERLFRFTRSLGIFNQSYFYQPGTDRLFVRVSGERTVQGIAFEVRFDLHLFPDRTVGSLISHRRDQREARHRADAFIDGLRSMR